MTVAQPEIGMVGIGRMGLPIARHFIAAGRKVVGYRRSDGEAFAAAGGMRLRSPADVFARAPVIITCLPDADALRQVIAGDDGFLSSGARGRIVIDVSTTDLATRNDLRSRLKSAGSTLIDCPISGIPPVLERRKAVFFASCDRAEFDSVAPLLNILSDEIHYVGPFGAGTKMKYFANFLLAIHVAATAEVLAAATAAGLDPVQTVELLGKGAGGSFQLTSRGPLMAQKLFGSAHADLGGLAGDLALIAPFASSLGLESHLLASAKALIDKSEALGFAHCDPAALIEVVQQSMHGGAKTQTLQHAGND